MAGSEEEYPPSILKYGTKPHQHWLLARADEYTVADVIAALGNDCIRWAADLPVRNFIEALSTLGLTATDWLPLAGSTKRAHEILLRRAGKNKGKLRALSARCVLAPGEMSRALEQYFFRSIRDITIGDLMCISGEVWKPAHDVHIERTITRVRKRLRNLGFTGKDGIFLHESSRLWHIEQIQKTLGYSKKRARGLFDGATRLGWAPIPQQ